MCEREKMVLVFFFPLLEQTTNPKKKGMFVFILTPFIKLKNFKKLHFHFFFKKKTSTNLRPRHNLTLARVCQGNGVS